MRFEKKNIYLDYAAASPVDSLVLKIMQPFFALNFANPSSLHKKGVTAQKAMEEARSKIANIINAKSEEIIFTSGGTESCNLAVLGTATAYQKGHIITSPLEHHAVLEPINFLQSKGYKISYTKVDREGVVDVEDVMKKITPQTFFISVMQANNEIGTIEPIEKLGRLLRSLNIKRKEKGLPQIMLHTDSCQAAGYLDLDVQKLGVDLMSLASSKIYGPKGIGLLYIKRGTTIKPIIFGGGQEFGMRSGTPNVAAIVGFAKALEVVQANKNSESSRLRRLQKEFVKKVLYIIKDSKLNGPEVQNLDSIRLPNNISLSFKGVEGEVLMLYLDGQGIQVSTASACQASSTERSHVIKSIGVKEEWARGTIRISLGKFTQKKDLDYALKVLKKYVDMLRRVESLNN